MRGSSLLLFSLIASNLEGSVPLLLFYLVVWTLKSKFVSHLHFLNSNSTYKVLLNLQREPPRQEFLSTSGNALNRAKRKDLSSYHLAVKTLKLRLIWSPCQQWKYRTTKTNHEMHQFGLVTWIYHGIVYYIRPCNSCTQMIYRSLLIMLIKNFFRFYLLPKPSNF